MQASFIISTIIFLIILISKSLRNRILKKESLKGFIMESYQFSCKEVRSNMGEGKFRKDCNGRRSIEGVYKSWKEIKSPSACVRLASKQGAVARSRYND